MKLVWGQRSPALLSNEIHLRTGVDSLGSKIIKTETEVVFHIQMRLCKFMGTHAGKEV